jgi:hypothetical protein
LKQVDNETVDGGSNSIAFVDGKTGIINKTPTFEFHSYKILYSSCFFGL